eukprot:TRINITY_DN12098_c0_g1_i1.p1 TRINITY_DN12098_c0_g1~~TRINITY_DN12098_c0_g1_i1.p1  ORF type:complete len:365 (+),score=45.57 TRINITY_DN12098_c0_g1_i1:96-1097(+)
MITFGGWALLEKEFYGQGEIMLTGTYFTLINIYRQFGTTLADLVTELTEVQQAAVYLIMMAELLNLETGARQRCNVEANNAEYSSTLMLSNVDFSYDNNVQLRGVSLQLNLGAILSVTGPKSSGKRTLMKIFAGILLPTSGDREFPVCGRCVLIDQSPVIMPWETVLENLLLCTASWITHPIAEQMAFALGLSSDVKARQLGITDQMLLCLGRALLSDPDILVVCACHWPGGDWQRKAFRLLRQWQKHGLLGVLLDACQAWAAEQFLAKLCEEAELHLRMASLPKDGRPVPRTIVMMQSDSQLEMFEPDERYELVETHESGVFSLVTNSVFYC